MFDNGVDQLGELVALVRSEVAGFDPQGLDATDAARVVECCSEAERLFAALRVVAAATLEDKALWRREGFRSVAAWMAAKTGTPVGTAIATMEMVDQLDRLPETMAAFRDGRLSEAQAREIAEAATQVPEAEAELLDAAAKLPLRKLQEECRRIEAAADVDENDRYRRVYRRRRYRAWGDRWGYGHINAVMTLDQLAVFDAEVQRHFDQIVGDAVRGGWFESTEAHRLDAFLELARPGGTEPSGPAPMLHVTVDFEALMRGHTVAGERCEIPGFGPIPVTLVEQMAGDARLKLFLTKGVDIAAAAHGGYIVPAYLRSALEVRDPTCIVPGCNVRRHLQVDHRDGWAHSGDTSLDNLARLCRWHHHLKTFCGYTYRRRADGSWEWIAPADLDQDFSALAKAITKVRRC